jgi:uncharacterized protein (TIGR01777 family)
MRITLTGATGRIGISLVEALVARGDDVTVLSRNPDGARGKLPPGVDAVRWDPTAGPAPAEALAGRDAVVHLAGEDVGQRWNKRVKQEIVDSRELGTRHLIDGMRAAEPRPRVLVSASASGFYGPRGDEPVGEDQPAGKDFLSDVVVRWEREAERASELGLRVVKLRTGIVLDAEGGALSKMLTPFKLGAGGPVAGGKQYMPWIHLEDTVAMYLQAIDDERWTGSINASAPTPVSNKEFSKALGRALKRPRGLPRAVLRHQDALRRDEHDRPQRGQHGAAPRHRSRVSLRAPRDRRGAQLDAGEGLGAPPPARGQLCDASPPRVAGRRARLLRVVAHLALGSDRVDHAATVLPRRLIAEERVEGVIAECIRPLLQPSVHAAPYGVAPRLGHATRAQDGPQRDAVVQ